MPSRMRAQVKGIAIASALDESSTEPPSLTQRDRDSGEVMVSKLEQIEMII